MTNLGVFQISPDIVKISMRHSFLQCQFVQLVEKLVHPELGRQVRQTTVAEGFAVNKFCYFKTTTRELHNVKDKSILSVSDRMWLISQDTKAVR